LRVFLSFRELGAESADKIDQTASRGGGGSFKGMTLQEKRKGLASTKEERGASWSKQKDETYSKVNRKKDCETICGETTKTHKSAFKSPGA
jgi:hypothetical protein